MKQPLSLAEAAVAPCIEFAVIEEGGAGGEEEDGEIQMEQEQGDANNDDPGLLTAQPHAVSDEVKKRHFCAIYHIGYIKCIILPRQARDKHRENSKKRVAFP